MNTDVRFENAWHSLRRALDRECDRHLPMLMFESLGEFNAQIRCQWVEDPVTLKADLNTRSVEIKDSGVGKCRLDFDDVETGGKFRNSRSGTILVPNKAAADFVERLIGLDDRHVRNPETGKLLCGRRADDGRWDIVPRPKNVGDLDTITDRDRITCLDCRAKLDRRLGAQHESGKKHLREANSKKDREPKVTRPPSPSHGPGLGKLTSLKKGSTSFASPRRKG
jgi:hypothetical protein